MIHELHMGSKLPSVVAGTPLKIGNADFSNVHYPADPGDPRRCETCHSQTTGAAQATAYLTNPTRAACGACHNDVNFATGENHVGGPQPNDNSVPQLPHPSGRTRIRRIHQGRARRSHGFQSAHGLGGEYHKRARRYCGPRADCLIYGAGRQRQFLPLSQSSARSRFTMAGPTTDYGYTSFGSGTASTPGYVTESAAKSSCDINGNCTYTFTHQVPSAAKGTYAIGVEARRTEVLLPGTTKQTERYLRCAQSSSSISRWTARQ